MLCGERGALPVCEEGAELEEHTGGWRASELHWLHCEGPFLAPCADPCRKLCLCARTASLGGAQLSSQFSKVLIPWGEQKHLHNCCRSFCTP